MQRRFRFRSIASFRPTPRSLAMVAAIACMVAPVVTLGSPAASAANGNSTNVLNSVSCANATTCFAVGATYTGPNSTTNNPAKPLIERWNGKTWSNVASPNPAGATKTVLADVSCTSATFCVAVGGAMQRWNGKAWSLVAGPASKGASVQAVSCTSTTFCIAVGNAIERWNGKTWAVVASPTPAPTWQLADVACTSPTNCFAVGNYVSQISFEALPLFEHWNGIRWSVAAGPDASAPNPRLNGVSCPSAAACVALGSGDTGLINSSTALTAHWNGKTWSFVAAAKFTARSDGLASLSCTGPKYCVAVGSYDNSSFNGQPNPLIEQWNGKTWSTVAAARSATGTGGWLSSASCTSPTNCFAVGASVTFISGGYYRQTTLVERWNGKTWATVASP